MQGYTTMLSAFSFGYVGLDDHGSHQQCTQQADRQTKRKERRKEGRKEIREKGRNAPVPLSLKYLSVTCYFLGEMCAFFLSPVFVSLSVSKVDKCGPEFWGCA